MTRGPRRFYPTVAALTLVAIAAPATADVTVGTANGANCFPFTCSYSGTYQQVYGSSAFSGPTTINTVQFFTNPSAPPDPNSNSYTLSFFLTASSVDGLSTDPTSNETTLLSSFGTFTPGTSYTFTGNSFTYDPALGNLLLDVSTSSSISNTSFLQAANDNDATSRLYQSFGNGPLAADTVGLVTRFSFSGGVPEPSTWAMMLVGFLGIGAVVRRRRSNELQQA